MSRVITERFIIGDAELVAEDELVAVLKEIYLEQDEKRLEELFKKAKELKDGIKEYYGLD